MNPFRYDPTAHEGLPHVLSLGAGRQSSYLYYAACMGFVRPTPIAAVFADTGWEPASVYRYLEYLEGLSWNVPIVRVTRGNIRDDIQGAAQRPQDYQGRRVAAMPFFLDDGGRYGFARRQCTTSYKVDAINDWISENVLGRKKGGRWPTQPAVVQWRGISMDEVQRATESREPWLTVRYPLLEMGMSAGDCIEELHRAGMPRPPKSSCIGCPFHSDQYWLEMKRTAPDEFEDACAFDDSIRTPKGLRGTAYLHSSRRPLREVEFKYDRQPDLFAGECEGMCGL